MKAPNTRIFVDCHVFDEGFQGTRSYIKGLYAELVKDETKHFFFAAKDTDNLRSEFGDGPNITYIAFKSKGTTRRLLLEIPKLIWKHKIQWAHLQYRVPPIKRCKYIVTTHDVLFIDFPEFFPVLGRIESIINYRLSARASEIVFTVSDYSKEKIAKHFGVKNAIVMPNGVPDVFFDDFDRDEIRRQVKEEFGIDDYLIYVSRREFRKNQHLLMKYFTELKLHEKMHLVFLGHETFKNPDFDAVWNQLDEAAREKILLFPNMGFEKMLLLVRGASASAYPSMAEGFGIPPLEAVAAKVPTICSNKTAMADFKFFGEDFFDPANAEEFKQKLLKVATAPRDEAQLELRRQIVKENYNWQKAADIFNAALDKFL